MLFVILNQPLVLLFYAQPLSHGTQGRLISPKTPIYMPLGVYHATIVVLIYHVCYAQGK